MVRLTYFRGHIVRFSPLFATLVLNILLPVAQWYRILGCSNRASGVGRDDWRLEMDHVSGRWGE